jgi:dTDP-4-dehydrorhamnose reductase
LEFIGRNQGVMHRRQFTPSAPALVVGASGLVGRVLWEALPPNARHGTFHAFPETDLLPLDVCDAQATASLVQRLRPSVIFHPAAIPNADTCAMEPARCAAVNIDGTTNVVEAARLVEASVVYFSTDYVFDGLNGPYGEQERPNPLNLYGETKLAGERIVAALDDHLIVRLTGVYGWERRGKNFVMGLIARLGRGERMKVPADQIGSPTFVDNMVAAVLELVGRGYRGLLHVAGSQALDRYTFACMAADIFDLDRTLLTPVPTEALGQKAVRPLRAGLKIDKAQSFLSMPLLAPAEGLRAMKAQGNPFAAGTVHARA